MEYLRKNDNSGSKTHPVGQKKANVWGLYDRREMYGNGQGIGMIKIIMAEVRRIIQVGQKVARTVWVVAAHGSATAGSVVHPIATAAPPITAAATSVSASHGHRRVFCGCSIPQKNRRCPLTF